MEDLAPEDDPNEGGSFMIGKKKFVVDDDKIKKAEELMKRFNANDSCDEDDPSSYLKLNNRRF